MNARMVEGGARPVVAHAAKREEALRIVHRWVAISAGAGMLSTPVLDVTLLAGVHVTLIKEISEHYGVPFSDHAARNILIAIGASIVPGSIGSVFGRRLLAALPFFSPPVSLLAMSVSSAAVSYGLGRLFIHHFESGGTLDTFDVRNLHRTLPWLFRHI